MPGRKLLSLFAVLVAVSLPAAALSAGSPDRELRRALRDAKVLALNELERNPAGYLGQVVAFDCFFAQTGGLYRPFYTRFIREHYVNFWVWRLDARLWEPKERQEAFFFCYVDRNNRKTLRVVQGLKTFAPIKVVARVEAVSQGRPWLEVLHVAPIDIPAYSEKGLKHIDLGMQQLEKGEFDFASRLFEVALAEKLPLEARKLVYRQIGMAYYKLGRYREAEEKLHAAERLIETPDPRLLLRLGQSKLHIGEQTGDKKRLKDAVVYLKRAVDQEPDLAEAHADLGLAYGLLGSYTAGLYSIKRALILEPQNARAFRNRATIYRRKNELDKAIIWLQQAILARANEPLYHRELGDVYMQVGQYTDAETEYRNFITLDPQNPEAHYLRATSRIAQGTPEALKQAIEDLKASITLDVQFRPSHLLLAKAYLLDNEWEKSAEVLRRAMGVFPQDIEIRLKMADLLKEHRLWEECSRVLDEAAKIDPENMDLRLRLARVLADKPQPDRQQAISVLEGILRAGHDTPEVRFLLGRLYVETSKPRQALQHLARYLKEHPKDVQALLYQGAAYAQGGMFRMALLANDKVLAIDKTNPFAANNKAYLFCLTGGPREKARELAALARQAQPQNATFTGTLSWALSLNEDYREAKKLAASAVEKGESAEGFFYLAVAEFGLGEADEAQQHVRRALELAKSLPKTSDNALLVRHMRELDGKVRAALAKLQRDLARQRRLEERRSRRRQPVPAAPTEETPPAVAPFPEG